MSPERVINGQTKVGMKVSAHQNRNFSRRRRGAGANAQNPPVSERRPVAPALPSSQHHPLRPSLLVALCPIEHNHEGRLLDAV